MPDYHRLQTLCDDVSRELEAAQREDTFIGEKERLVVAERFAIELFRCIVRATGEFEKEANHAI